MKSRQILHFSIGPLGGAALTLLALPITAWTFSAEDIGRIAILHIFSTFCVLITTLGLEQAYVREYHESKNKFQLLQNSFWPGFSILLIFLGLATAYNNSLSNTLFANDSWRIGIAVALYTILSYILRFTSATLRMEERGLAFSSSQISQRLVLLAAIIYLYKNDLTDNFTYLLAAHLLSLTTGTALSIIQIKKTILKSLKQKIEYKIISKLLSFGAPLVISGVGFWVLTSADRIVIEKFLTLEQLGHYSIAISLAGAAGILQNIFSTLWAPTIYKWNAAGKTYDIAKYTESIFAVVILLYSVTGLFAWVVPYILPSDYSNIHYILVACMAYPFFFTLSEATSIGIGIKRKNNYNMIAMTICAAICICLNLTLTLSLGTGGAATSLALSFWLLLLIRYELSTCIWLATATRWKLYLSSATTIATTSCYATLGEAFPILLTSAWFANLLFIILIFKDNLLEMFQAQNPK